MRQAVMTKPGKIEMREIPVPQLNPEEVLIRIRCIGVCGSDVHVYQGTHPFTSYPVVQGHEYSGIVEDVGEKVKNIKIGTKVTSLPQIVCRKCKPCLREDYNICENLKVQGFQAPGCAKEFFVTKEEKVVPLPDSFTFEQGALVEPCAVGVHAVSKAGKIKGKKVAVLGAGPIGNFVAQVAQTKGAEVLTTDISDFRLDKAEKCGLKFVSNPKRETLKEASERLFDGESLEVIFECVGKEETINSAIEVVEKGGKIMVVGVYGERPGVNLGLVQDRELQLLGSLMYKLEDYEKAIELIDKQKIITAPLISQHFSFNQYQQAYKYIEKQKDRSLKVFVCL